MAPYRTIEREQHVEAPRDAGIVGDVIAQFADPLAFYRELVQNSIDAGSPSVEVRLDYDGPANAMRAIVRDRGEGMTREIIEEQLLVLFRSTKEGVAGKIGKFGIGFASVLSPQPNIVVVQSSRDGRRLALHLERDLTYQLFDAGPATQTGTSVELEIPMAPDLAPKFVQDSLGALKRWCRHATVPIELESSVEPTPLKQRIDEPLALADALVEVHGGSDGLVALVGLGTTGIPYGGFFNHGLMLYETNEPLAGRVSFKIQDARLGHTISRDNVRRDARFDFAMTVVRELVANQLPLACTRAMKDAADDIDRKRFHALVRAIGAADLKLPAATWVYPLVEPLDGKRSIAGSALGSKVFGCGEGNAITQLMAAAKRPVIDLSDAGAQIAIKNHLGAENVVDVRYELTVVTPLPVPLERDSDRVLVDTLWSLLDNAFRAPPSIVLAAFDGALMHSLSIAGEDSHAFLVASDGRKLFDREAAERSPFARLRPSTLILNVDHAHVKSAREASDPRLAAAHLARSVLLSHKALDIARSAKLLGQTLAQLGVR